MSNQDRIALDLEELDNVRGGTLVFNPDGSGKYNMTCCFCGTTYPGLTLAQVMQVIKYSAKIPNTAEGEQKIIGWAQSENII